MLSPTGWVLTTLAGVSLAALVPDAPALVADLDGRSFPDALLAGGSLVQLACSLWIVLPVLLTLLRAPTRVLHAVTPRLVRRALFAGTASALAFAPACADRVVSPDASSGHDIVGLGVPDRPTSGPSPTARSAADRPRARGARPVVVRAGDTLWAIAADSLPRDSSLARTARECARWHEANREVIGPDPDLIFPAQRLIPPAAKDQT